MAGLLCHTLKVFSGIQAPANENRPSERMLGEAAFCFIRADNAAQAYMALFDIYDTFPATPFLLHPGSPHHTQSDRYTQHPAKFSPGAQILRIDPVKP